MFQNCCFKPKWWWMTDRPLMIECLFKIQTTSVFQGKLNFEYWLERLYLFFLRESLRSFPLLFANLGSWKVIIIKRIERVKTWILNVVRCLSTYLSEESGDWENLTWKQRHIFFSMVTIFGWSFWLCWCFEGFFGEAQQMKRNRRLRGLEFGQPSIYHQAAHVAQKAEWYKMKLADVKAEVAYWQGRMLESKGGVDIRVLLRVLQLEMHKARVFLGLRLSLPSLFSVERLNWARPGQIGTG